MSLLPFPPHKAQRKGYAVGRWEWTYSMQCYGHFQCCDCPQPGEAAMTYDDLLSCLNYAKAAPALGGAQNRRAKMM